MVIKKNIILFFFFMDHHTFYISFTFLVCSVSQSGVHYNPI
ncbi:hypothetical protein B4167_1552 [Caldibacillus thermoamylovorans]|uniref:Secreted protein n=1 Tax=Caldibacillus thermoamylovorans TaxID=35841 RepID=A0ABD4AAQ4_9BACI|nr:hypothetical protein B4167_1552 [Caldibacillus thermoamylovorans]